MIHTKETLMEDFRNMGLTGKETIMIHSSMKSIGEVEGGGETVIDAWMEFFKEGLLLAPTHTWDQMSETYNVFDREKEPGCVGILPNLLRKRAGVVRSLHPTHSIAAYSADTAKAEKYIAGEENACTPCPPGGAWDRLRQEKAKILLLGVTHIRNTYIHSIEEVYDVPQRFTEKTTAFYIKMPDGSLKKVDMYRHFNSIAEGRGEVISDNFDKMKEIYFRTGAAKAVRFGDAECILCDAEKLFQVTGKVLEQNKDAFIALEEIPYEG